LGPRRDVRAGTWIPSSGHKADGRDVEEAVPDHMGTKRESTVAVHMQEAYGHSYHSYCSSHSSHSCAADTPPYTAGSACWEDLGYRDIPVASLTAPWAAAHGASRVTGGSS